MTMTFYANQDRSLSSSPAREKSRASLPVLPELPDLVGPADNLEQALAVLGEARRIIKWQEHQLNKMERHVVHDELTGLLNRQGFLSMLRRELVLSRRTEKHAGLLILIDMDDFHHINKLYGFETGNSCLQSVASVLINEVRTSDYVARLGKDNFAILLPDIPMRAAGKRLEELERVLCSRIMHTGQHAIPLNASFGFAVLHESKTPDALIATAEQKLMASKSRRKMGMKG